MRNDLVAWLLEQIAEDGRRATAADVKQGDPSWWVSEVRASGGVDFTVRTRRDNRPVARVKRLDGDGGEPAGILDGAAVAGHIACWDPARVLAECDAKRQIIGLVNLDFNDEGEPICLGGYGEAYWDILRLLALPYADRPGYREEWRP